MNTNELAFILEHFYYSRPDGTKAISPQIFGIYFADQIKNSKEIIEKTSLPKTYSTEINKGKKISNYTQITDLEIIDTLKELKNIYNSNL